MTALKLLIWINTGVHFNVILPWLAVAAMLINVISGLTGKFLLERSRRHLAQARDEPRRSAREHERRGRESD